MNSLITVEDLAKELRELALNLAGGDELKAELIAYVCHQQLAKDFKEVE